MEKLPSLNPITGENQTPHVFILGAGASRASFPNGDKNGKVLPLMNDLIDVLELNRIFEKTNIPFEGENFEDVFDQLSREHLGEPILNNLESSVREYFSNLYLPPEVTLYDYLILALRPKDVIATFNWDPLLALSYMRNSHLIELPQLLFLHGNVSIGYCIECKIKGCFGTQCKWCGKPYKPSILLFPVSDKSYTEDAFISSEWNAMQLYLQEAYLITIFGYSAPRTDAAARDLMISVWNKNKYKNLAQFGIIDIRPKEILHAEWSEYITRDHYGIFNNLMDTYLFRYPRRSCEALSSATLMLEPWPTNRIPPNLTLIELQDWISFLIQEEQDLRRNGVPFSRKPIKNEY